MISSRIALDWTPDFGLALTFAVGALLTIVASGDRRWLTTLRQSVGQALPVLGILVGVGAVSAYGAASVLGVPFALAFLETGNVVVITSALSLLAGLGDLMPPTGLAMILLA